MKEKKIIAEEYLSAKTFVPTDKICFYDWYKRMIAELKKYFDSNLVCGQQITKFEAKIGLLHHVYVFPIEPRFNRSNFSSSNIDIKAMDDIKEIAEKDGYDEWELCLTWKG